ncbi:hypothetical protein L3V83_12890 [Thiotrichales bacterium 19X7-9]|nr:hypothetical protein [Thiotrichales bacterium 19X7-9]
METKTIKSYLYEGLGFSVELEEVKLEKLLDGWAPIIDVEKIAEEAVKALASHTSRLTGNQIKFIRHYFSMSLRDFASKVVSESHVAVVKWEKCANESSNMDINIEKMIRLYIYEKMFGQSNFYNYYINIRGCNFIHNDNEILKISISDVNDLKSVESAIVAN